ncbi:MAG TPA: DUF4149 domain-containing protein [Trueperaceae bacterium]
MNTLDLIESLIAGLWLGSYLFTHTVVSPALASLPFSDAERVRLRSVIGRRYGSLAGPLLLTWLAVLLLQGLEPWTLLRLGLIVILALAVITHGYYVGRRMQALAEQEIVEERPATATSRAALQRLSARITPVSLVVSLLLAVLTLL